MCCPSSMATKTIILFKIIEPLFWFMELMITVNLFMPKDCFAVKLKWLNKFLKYQGFDSQIKYAEKAYKTWHRDLWILFFLVPIVIYLIHII